MASVFERLTPAERARQLANPDGAVGLAVAEWLNANNQEANAQMLALLDVKPGARVLEVGFGNGRTTPNIISAATDVHYTGIDLSPTMVAEATRFNAELVATGRATLHLGTAEHMPFPDASFDRVFSLGVIHFWADPAHPLSEIRRVLRPGGMALLGCLAPRSANESNRPEYGFFLREASEWGALCRAARFSKVEVEEVERKMINPDATPISRYGIRLMAWA